MTKQTVITWLTGITEEAKTAILATTDRENRPHLRWVSPAFLHQCPESIFMVTSPDFPKTSHISVNPNVGWMFQSQSLDKIVNINGTIAIHYDSLLTGEVLEAVGPRLQTFWKVNPDRHSLIVLETIIESAVCFVPQKGLKETVNFRQDKTV